ncbi:MAG: DUF177 domain-containing protein [Actinobacteria bacterium]|nr:DUF177 domain-containing protein [Actinomycetota bacterium]
MASRDTARDSHVMSHAAAVVITPFPRPSAVADTTMTAFRINVADLLHRPGSRRALHLEAPLAGLAVTGSAVPDDAPVAVDVLLERVPEGVVVRGVVRAPWEGPCRRCLRPVHGEIDSEVQELFETTPLEGETYPLEHDHLDLALPVRDVVLLELPVAPVCRADCAGLCPVCGRDRNEDPCSCKQSTPDPRWAALSQLEL